MVRVAERLDEYSKAQEDSHLPLRFSDGAQPDVRSDCPLLTRGTSYGRNSTK